MTKRTVDFTVKSSDGKHSVVYEVRRDSSGPREATTTRSSDQSGSSATKRA